MSAEETILRRLNIGYRLAEEIYEDYSGKLNANTFQKERDLELYRARLTDWVQTTRTALVELFPTDMEANLFAQRFSVSASTFPGMDSEIGYLVYERVPRYIERLNSILEIHLRRYLDLPLAERLYVEGIDSFSKVRDVNPAEIAHRLREGRIDLTEDEVQFALEAILNVPFHRKDWAGELNDLYTANVVVNGARRCTAFLLKGSGLRKPEMTIADCGRNGDQIQRLFQSPAEIFVVQYVGRIADSVISELHDKTVLRRTQGQNANYLVIDGQDTARLLYAYGKLPL